MNDYAEQAASNDLESKIGVIIGLFFLLPTAAVLLAALWRWWRGIPDLDKRRELAEQLARRMRR